MREKRIHTLKEMIHLLNCAVSTKMYISVFPLNSTHMCMCISYIHVEAGIYIYTQVSIIFMHDVIHNEV